MTKPKLYKLLSALPKRELQNFRLFLLSPFHNQSKILLALFEYIRPHHPDFSHKNLDKKLYLIKIPFFESLLKLLKPSFHKRLYESLEIDNTITKKKLSLKNPYTVDEGIKAMIRGEES